MWRESRIECHYSTCSNIIFISFYEERNKGTVHFVLKRKIFSKKSKETLAGRSITLRVFPLNFLQFLHLNDGFNGTHLHSREKPLFTYASVRDYYERVREQETEIKKALNTYLIVGGFIEWFKVQDIFRWQQYLQDDILNKLILGDIAEEYDLRDEEALRRIILVLSENSGNLYSFHSLAHQAVVGKDIIEKYLSSLANGFVIYQLNNFSGHIKIQLRKNKKINLIDVGLINAVKRLSSLKEEHLSFLMEKNIQNHCFYFTQKNNMELNFYRDKEQREVDAVLSPELLPIEVKYSSRVSRRDLPGLIFFMERFKADRGLVITKDILREEHWDGKTILYIPCWLFLLMVG